MWEDEARVMDDQKGGAKNGRSLQNSWGIHSMNEMALHPTAMGVLVGFYEALRFASIYQAYPTALQGDRVCLIRYWKQYLKMCGRDYNDKSF